MTSRPYFSNLDGWRTVACLMVFFWHALTMGHRAELADNEFIKYSLLAFVNGRNGVSFFFVLSGFLITYLLLTEIRNRGKLNIGGFYMRRVLRIWPLYFLVLLVIFVAIPIVMNLVNEPGKPGDARPGMYFTFLSNFDVLRIMRSGGADFLPSTITWSVAIEEQFYLVWPLFFLVIPLRHLHYFLCSVIAGALLFRLLNYDRPHQLYFHSLSAVLDLAIGGITAWLCLFNERFREFFASLANPSRILLLIGGISIMYLVAMPGNGVVKVLLTFLQAVFFALIITDQCFNKNTALKMSSNKLFTSLGKYTYGMYMLHPLVLLALNTISVRVLHWNISGTRAVSTAAIAGLLLTYLLARLSYHLFEKRFLRLKGIYATAKNNYPLPAGRIDADPNKTN